MLRNLRIIKQKLSGDLLYRPEKDYENWREYRGEYIDIPINVVYINDTADGTEFTHLEIGINIQLPRLTNEEDLIKVANFINDHLTYGYGDDAILIDEKNFISNKKICGMCGCLLEIKTSWASEKCPIDKWKSEIFSENESVSQPIPASGDCGCNKK